MITKFARLEFELFTKPSKSDFLRVYQIFSASDSKKTFISLSDYFKRVN